MIERKLPYEASDFGFNDKVNVLSRRQLEVLMLMCLDQSRTEIARTLGLSQIRVDQLLRAIRRNLDVNENYGAVAKVIVCMKSL